MLLVGFYNQAFYLLAPAILALLLEAKERVSSLLVAGFLYFLVLQQGGHAFPAIGYALGVASLLAAAAAPAQLSMRWLHPLLVLLGFGAPLALEAYGDLPIAIPIGWGATALALALLPGGRDFVRSALPFVGRLGGLLATSLALGVGKVVGLLHLDRFGEYATQTVRAIRRVATEFPGLSLHDRLAIIVPDRDFRSRLGPLLERQLAGCLPRWE